MVNIGIQLPHETGLLAYDFTQMVSGTITHFDAMLETVAAILLNGKIDKFKIVYNRNLKNADCTANLIMTSEQNGFYLDEPWREMKDLKFLASQKHLNLSFYINDSTKQVIVTGVCDYVSYHFLCAVFTRLAPWYFTEKLNQKEIALLSSFLENNSNNTIKWLIEYFAQPEFRKAKLTKNIQKINRLVCQSAINNAQEAVEIQRSCLDEAERKYIEARDKFREANIKLNGLMMNGNNDKMEELTTYLQDNTGIEILETSDLNFSIVAKGYLTNVDADILEEYAANEKSFLYVGRIAKPCFEQIENKRKLLLALFGNNAKYRVKVAAIYYLTSYKVETYSKHRIDDIVEDHENFIVNPHVYYFACLGEYKPLITNALRDGDIIQAMDLCIASVSSMNIAESATATKFLDELYTTSKKCIVDEYGNSMTPEEALNKIESEENNG